MPTAKATTETDCERDLREKGWTLRTAAERLGVDHTHLHRVAKGTRESVSLLMKIKKLPRRPRPLPKL